MGTINVYVRDLGDACWRTMTLPVSIQAAVTLASAARTLNLADQVRLNPAAPTVPTGPGVDLRV